MAENFILVKGERGDGNERLTPPDFLVLMKKGIQNMCEPLLFFCAVGGDSTLQTAAVFPCLLLRIGRRDSCGVPKTLLSS